MSTPARGSSRPPRSRLRRLGRLVLRCARTAGVGVAFVVALVGLYFNKVGLPDAVKDRVVSRLRAAGWEVQFSRLRLRWSRGIVAEHLELRRAGQPDSLQVFVDQAECRVNRPALLRGGFQVEAVRVRDGRVFVPLATPSAASRPLVLNRVNGELRLRPDDTWEVKPLHLEALNVGVRLEGTLRHASRLRDWKFPPRTPDAAQRQRELWPRVLHAVEKLRFEGPTLLEARGEGDAADFRQSRADLKFLAARLDSPWGSGANLRLSATLAPPRGSNHLFAVTFDFSAGEPRTPWGEAETLQVVGAFEPSRERLLATDARLTLGCRAPQTAWGEAEALQLRADLAPSGGRLLSSNVHLKADLRAPLTRRASAEHLSLTANLAETAANTNVLNADWQAVVTDLSTEWGQAGRAALDGRGLLPLTNGWTLTRTNLDWPARLAGLDLRAALTNVTAPRWRVSRASLTSDWRAPALRFEAGGLLADRGVAAQGTLDADARELLLDLRSEADPREVAALVSTNAARFLTHVTWTVPPRLEARGRVVLPAWTNRQPDWRGEVLPSVSARGRCRVGEGAFRALAFNAVETAFEFTNQVWRLPDLKLVLPEGDLEAAGFYAMSNGEFGGKVASRLDPKVVKGLLTSPKAQRALDYFQFTTPPRVEASVTGNARDLDRLGAAATVVMSNLTFRGEAVRHVQTGFRYTNQVLTFLEPRMVRDEGQAGAPGITIDLAAQKLFLTNVQGTLDPQAVARVISSAALKAVEPFRFERPPATRVNGVVGLIGSRHDEDLHFHVAGGPFQWLNFRLRQITGDVFWVAERVTLTNMQGAFRTGRVEGDARLDFTHRKGADFSFAVAVHEADLREVLTDVTQKTNRLEGIFGGQLTVTRADTEDWGSWQGHGRVDLRDGLIWDIPAFGVFSPVLNAFAPGLGNSRARQGLATFTLTNSVFQSSDLEIQATGMRMRFRGTLDFHRQVDARVEAGLLRNLPGVGLVVSTVFWPVTKLFEYRLTGTLENPKAEPLYVVPHILLLPTLPFRILKDVFTPEPKSDGEGPPPPAKPK